MRQDVVSFSSFIRTSLFLVGVISEDSSCAVVRHAHRHRAQENLEAANANSTSGYRAPRIAVQQRRVREG
jgi:hypothetical protein